MFKTSPPGDHGRRVHGPEQGVVRGQVRLLRLRPADDGEDQVLRGGPQAGVQEVLRQVSSRPQAQAQEVPRVGGCPGPATDHNVNCKLLCFNMMMMKKNLSIYSKL